jgi:hypothetical protein
MQQRLGMRQAHIAPVLSESVQPVIVIDDITTSSTTRWPYAAWDRVIGDGISFPGFTLFNRASSGRRMRVCKIFMDLDTPVHTGVINIGLGVTQGASANPTGLKGGGFLHVVASTETAVPNDVEARRKMQAAGILIGWIGSTTGASTIFEQRVFGHQAVVGPPASPIQDQRKVFEFEPALDLWIYPNSGISWYPDGTLDMTWESSAWWEEEDLKP